MERVSIAIIMLSLLLMSVFSIQPAQFYLDEVIYDATSSAISGTLRTVTGFATATQSCMKSSSTRQSPDGSMECSDSRSGCLNGQDWKFYEVVGSGGKRVTVRLAYSGSGCAVNDLYVYQGDEKMYYSITNLKDEDWFGLPTSDITVGLDGDSENDNCKWKLEVKCDTRMMDHIMEWPLPPTPPIS
jgi:hypothetical protein